MWGLLALVPIVALAGAASRSAPQPLTDLLMKLSGDGAVACGVVVRNESARAALACAREQLASGRPFRLAVQVQGIDSLLWLGVALEADGTSWVLSYDSDTHGRGGIGKESLDSVPCHEIRLSETDGRRIWCGLKGDG
jgi:hypothetical protein